MQPPRFTAGVFALLLCTAPGIYPAAAKLPSLDKSPWLGYFAAFSNKHFQFGVTSLGKIILTPTGEKNDPIRESLAIPIEITITETQADGKPTIKQIKTETLESSQPETAKLETSIIRGKITGDASFEVSCEQNRGAISLGGRMLDSGNLKKNPLRFSMRIQFPNAYPFDKPQNAKEKKEFQKKIEGDHIDLTFNDGKRKKQSFDQAVTASPKELNGPGIAAAELDISAYKGTKLLFRASPYSSMTLSNDPTEPLHKGFTLHWLPDPVKDPDGKARLSIEVK